MEENKEQKEQQQEQKKKSSALCKGQKESKTQLLWKRKS